MVWSSARPVNVEGMCQKLLSKDQIANLVGIWSRDDLRLPANAYKRRVQVYKQLSWVWQNEKVQSAKPNALDPRARWDQTNTVLIDDNAEKAASEPHNLIEIDEFAGKKDQAQVDVLGQVVKYLESLRWQRDASAYIRSTPFVYNSNDEFDWTPYTMKVN